MSGCSSSRTRRRRARVSSATVRAVCVLAQRGQVDGEVVGGGQGVGVVVAEYPAAPRECVLVEAAGVLVVVNGAEDVRQVVRGRQRPGVVVAQDPSAPGERLLA